METDAKSLVHRWFEEVWNQGREATIDELFGEESVALGVTLRLSPGKAGAYFVSRSKRLAGVADAAPVIWATLTVAGYSSSLI